MCVLYMLIKFDSENANRFIAFIIKVLSGVYIIVC